MKVSFEKIKEIVTGVSYVEKQDAYIQFHRFNKAEEAYYKDAEFPRHFATSGVRLEFETNSETLKLKVHTKKATPALYFSHDILLNGKKIGDIANFDTLDAKTRKPVGEFHLGDFEGEFVLGSGIKQVSILFPWSVNSMLETLEIDDGATIYATKKTKKLIAYGDSISYGASCVYPSGRYVSRLSDALGAEEVCKAIGGEVFCPGLVACADEAEADCVTVAYGTNDITSRDVEDIERSRARRGYGTQVLINHGFGYKTRYAHLNKLHVEKGDTVKRGQLIGDMGNTGQSTSPHLHYEVIYNRTHVNPINYFDKNMSADAYKSLMNQIQEATYETE